MSIRSVQCPGCGAIANVPAAMANVKCPACATVWNVGNPSAAQISPAAKRTSQPEPDSDDAGESSNAAAIVVSLIGGGVFLLAMIGLAIVILSRPSEPTATAEVEETIKPLIPEEYRIVNLPEATRRRIYDDYRQVARTTVEVPLALPQDWKIRKSLETTLDKTYERELMRFAALHDVTVDDVREVIKEGDAKVWDDSPRSHAVRDGKRVYAKEKSEGWEKKK